MQIQDIIHPLDKAAREKLEGIPGFSIAVKSYLKIGLETYLHGINMANFPLPKTVIFYFYRLREKLLYLSFELRALPNNLSL